MLSRSPSTTESPALILDRATSLVDYLMAVRAQMEKPARTVPQADAFWQHELPAHADCQVGVSPDGSTWLRVGLPGAPKQLRAPAEYSPYVAGPLSYETEPRLAGDEETVERLRERFEQWRERDWRPWSEQARRTEAVRRLHRSLFDLKHRVDMNAATHELVWGHGVLRTDVGSNRVQYPLIVTPMAIEFDADRSMITVVPQGAGRLQTDPLTGLDERYLSQLLDLAGSGGQLDLDVWDDFTRLEFFERALRRLGLDPTVRPADAPGPTGSYVHDTGVLFVRPRQRMLRRFLEELRARLISGDTASIGALAAILAHEPSRLEMPHDQPARWTPLGERLLMPLPTNEAQESIARRLAQHRNVAVQGPPGTGKTHTIRNLICHLMAHGKRVLVVAQKEDPLRVLRDGLPQEIQSLCLAVLGRSTDQLVQLQLAARELSDRGATLDRRSEQQRVDRLRRQLEEAERDLGQALGALRTLAENESAQYEIDGIRLSPSDVGSWLRDRAARYGDIPDEIPPHLDAPLTVEEFTDLLDIARRTVRQDRTQSLRHLPTAAALPTASALLAARRDLAATRAELDRLIADGVTLAEVRAFGRPALDELVGHLREALAVVAAREGAWTDRLARLLQADPNWRAMWEDHVAACQRALAEIAASTRVVAGHRVAVSDPHLAEPRRLLAQLGELRQRFAAGKGVSKLFQGTLAKLAADCRVDGEILRTTQDVDVVLAYVNRLRIRQELATRWTEWGSRLALPRETSEPELWAGRLLSDAATALDWDRRRWPTLHATTRRLVPRVEPAVDVRRLKALTDTIARCSAVFEYDRLVTDELNLGALLQHGMSNAEASELWRLLDQSRQRADVEGWDGLLDEVRRLAGLRPDAQRFVDLAERLRQAAPAWTAEIDAGEASALAGSGGECLHRWQWRRAQTWFDAVVGSVDPVALGRRVEQTRDRIRRLTQELVVASSWLEVSLALDDRRRAALADWTTALRKIGKGTGKNAAQWQAHAQRAMSAAVDAVPVWVMSVDRAIEQFAGGAHFDVVIVDEASQADMFSLPVLSLAERAVVVGDDQQIGPQLSFVGTVTGLINSHLVDVPSAEHFDPESSLYDHAVRRSPERILLTEHFRSVPAIIGFSSEAYYGGEIEPLRTDRPAGIGDPVIAVHVPEGIRQGLVGYGDVNVPEAEALVARVAAIVADPAYEGRSIGVVSLLSTSGQALYLLTRLREEIGEEEMERRRLRVGDSYTFQGDERDIVLVSMVVEPHHGPVSAFTKRDHHRRVNVAASRARDQLWVFHSVQPADLREDDARGLLLTYCQNVSAVDEAYDDLEKRCDSDFEREVLRRILRRGYRPLPQFRIGGYRIDFVLPAPDGRRLAIECDGDAYHGPDQWESDMRRQAVLERVGNCVFVRIRGSVFSRDPEAALEPLWQRIDELGIVVPPDPPSPPTPPHRPAPGGGTVVRARSALPGPRIGPAAPSWSSAPVPPEATLTAAQGSTAVAVAGRISPVGDVPLVAEPAEFYARPAAVGILRDQLPSTPSPTLVHAPSETETVGGGPTPQAVAAPDSSSDSEALLTAEASANPPVEAAVLELPCSRVVEAETPANDVVAEPPPLSMGPMVVTPSPQRVTATKAAPLVTDALVDELRTMLDRRGARAAQSVVADFVDRHRLTHRQVDALVVALTRKPSHAAPQEDPPATTGPSIDGPPTDGAGGSAEPAELSEAQADASDVEAAQAESDAPADDDLAWMFGGDSQGSAARAVDDVVGQTFDDLLGDWVRSGQLSRADVALLATKRKLSSAQHGELLSLLEDAGVELPRSTDVRPKQAAPKGYEHDGDSVGQYLRAISRYPLIGASREVELWSLISQGVAAQKELEAGGKELAPSARLSLERRVADGRRAHAELVCANLRLVVSIARQRHYDRSGVEFADRVQDGNIGLMRAADKFDGSMGTKFSTYATWWIRQSIDRGVADRGRTIRIPVHLHEKVRKVRRAVSRLTWKLDREPTLAEISEETGVEPGSVQAILDLDRPLVSIDMLLGEEGDLRLSDILLDDDNRDGRTDPAEVVIHAMFRTDVARTLAALLPDRAVRILERRFGFGTGDEETLDAIGAHFNVTRERIRQIQGKSLATLRESEEVVALRSYLVDDSKAGEFGVPVRRKAS
ncbi:sigma-70 family RNA polymerase sigma factor [Micromonospora sp. CA-244673]|uniref:sigma-70 family RNA polymerase sigma factor n=1 Tax=Micromonospora sp. CA-244673 TaxID=3239958 RepID=UPI003D8DCB9C